MIFIRKLAIAVVAFCPVGLLATATVASAHAQLVSSDPPANALLDESPDDITLTFSENVDMVADSMRLVASDGSAVEIGDANQSQGGDTISADVPALDPGTYVVAWRALSADSHPISGAFTFSVQTETETAPGLVDDLLSDSESSASAAWWLGLGRALSYAGVALLLGGFVVLARCAPAHFASSRAGIVLAAGVVSGVIGTAIMVMAQASITVGSAFDPSAWQSVFDTRSGMWWVIRLLLFVLGALAVPVRRVVMGSAIWPSVCLLYGAALVGVTAAGGHGISGRWIPVAFVATGLHIAAMSVWIGGLAAIGVVVPRRDIWATLGRFSPLALGSVVALAITGAVNGWRQAGSYDALTGSEYGSWLIVKLVLVAGVVAIAGVNRWLLHQRLDGGPEDDDGSEARAVRRTVFAEMAGMVLVLGATAGLVNTPPPRESVAGPVSISVVEGDRIIQVVLDPPVTGGTTMHVYVTSSLGTLGQPEEMSVTASLPSNDISGIDLGLERAGPGHLTSDVAVFPIAGTWTVQVTVRYSEFDQITVPMEFDIR